LKAMARQHGRFAKNLSSYFIASHNNSTIVFPAVRAD